MAETSEPRKQCWMCAGIFFTGVASFVALSHLISDAIDKVTSGRGLETYRTFWLVEFNYVGLLIMFGCLVIALFAAGGMWAYEWWQWRDLERKYGGKRRNT
jgi:hypothetical protein